MKWWETLGIVIIFGGMAQLIKWILDSLGANTLEGDTLTFLISIIFTTLVVIVIIQIEQNKDIKKMKNKLKIKESNGIISKFLKNKKGTFVNPWILLWILVIVLIYLFLKSIKII